MTWLAIALGGALGALARYGVGVMTVRLLGHGFPLATLMVNIAGSFLMGLLIAGGARAGWLEGPGRALLAVGFLGSFTTFSTFALDTVTLWERGQSWAAFGYALASIVGALGGLVLGLMVMRR